MKDTITLPRKVVKHFMIACEINGWSTFVDTLQAALDAPAPTEDPMLACDIAPRPLGYPLSHYHLAIGGGPLHFTWKDKPHRLVYDLIAAVKYYAQQPAPTPEPQPPVLTEAQAKQIMDMALDLEKTGRLVSLTEGQERSDFVARNRGIQCALEDYLRNLAELADAPKAAHGIKEGS